MKHKNREPLRDSPGQIGFFRHQVEYVKLIYPGRNDEERNLMNLLRRWGILDELNNIILEDDLARRHGQITANLERIHICLADAQEVF